MKPMKPILCAVLAALIVTPPPSFAASHREAPITALDHKADITDFFAFVSYENNKTVTFLLNVDPFLEPGNGPNYFPFDDNVLYQVLVDNNNDAQPEVSFQIQFHTTINAPGVFTGYVGAGNGLNAPANAPPSYNGGPGPGSPIIPPAITALSGSGAAGLSLSQTYTVTMVQNGNSMQLTNSTGAPLYAVPSNVGPRTMPNYPALAEQGVYLLNNGIKVFAGTVDDPFYIDLGGAFDSLNFRTAAGGGVLSPGADANDNVNTAPDYVSGFNVNTIAIQVPIQMLTSTGNLEASTSTHATIGAWGTTSRPRIFVRRAPLPSQASGGWSQVQRMGNPLINELIIGTGSKDMWSMSQPVNDSQFANFDLDPLLARVLNTLYGIPVPPAPRTDLLPLVTYAVPIAAPGTTAGPIADLLRLNTGVPPTPQASRKRLGLLAGDAAGFPNGRRVSDDVTDIAARAVAGILAGSQYNYPIGDGVNTNDVPYQEVFPYVAWAQSGRQRRHIDPGETGCTMGAGSACPTN